MKNKEKYAKEIVELACDGDGIAVDKRDCDKAKREWEEPEYIEKFDAKKLELTRKELDSVIYHDFMKKGTM